MLHFLTFVGKTGFEPTCSCLRCRRDKTVPLLPVIGGTTGFEPVFGILPRVTIWCLTSRPSVTRTEVDSNHQRGALQTPALPLELPVHNLWRPPESSRVLRIVWCIGFEPIFPAMGQPLWRIPASSWIRFTSQTVTPLIFSRSPWNSSRWYATSHSASKCP